MKDFSFSKHFSDIYANNRWLYGSGPGSLPIFTIEYRVFLTKFINYTKVKNVIDFGCGDWQFSQFIDWGTVNYIGIDCVDFLIEENKNKFSKSNINFRYLEKLEDFFTYNSELLIIKDVIQHWLCSEITYFLDNIIDNFDYILITNTANQKEDWQDYPERSRPLSANYYPLKKYNPIIMMRYKADPFKEISLIEKK